MRKCAFGKCALSAVAVAAGLIGAAYFLGFGSHMSTAWKELSHSVKRQVPPEFEIARIHDQLDQIDPDIKKSLSGLAEESVAVDNLRTDIAEAKVRLEKEKKVVLMMKADLETGAKTVAYRGIELTADELRDRLTQEFDAYKAAEKALKAKEDVLKAKQAGLDAAKQKIAAMRTAKEQLEAELAKTEADLKMVQLKQTENKFQVDDTRLSNIKQSMRSLKDRVAAMEKARQLDIQFNHDQVVNQVEQKVKADEVLKEIDTHFGHTAGNNVADDK
jgi:septal ring factor EnvC (AmiA/AmiB activator)